MWRISREIMMRDQGQVAWLPIADILCLVSLVTIVAGVFILPILGLADLVLATRLFGLALVLFAGYPFALAGHYQLFRIYASSRQAAPAPYLPKQEAVVSVLVVLCAIAYVAFLIMIGSESIG